MKERPSSVAPAAQPAKLNQQVAVASTLALLIHSPGLRSNEALEPNPASWARPARASMKKSSETRNPSALALLAAFQAAQWVNGTSRSNLALWGRSRDVPASHQTADVDLPVSNSVLTVVGTEICGAGSAKASRRRCLAELTHAGRERGGDEGALHSLLFSDPSAVGLASRDGTACAHSGLCNKKYALCRVIDLLVKCTQIRRMFHSQLEFKGMASAY